MIGLPEFNSILRIEFVLEKDFSNLLGIILISKSFSVSGLVYKANESKAEQSG